MNLSDRFGEALAYAERLHRDQRRKGNDIPYVAHLMAVAAGVLEWGGDEDTAIAALLHDAVEDQGGLPRADEIRSMFGDRVAGMVLSCTDSVASDPATKLPWKQRKRAYVEHLAMADHRAVLIATCDKLHNLTALVRDLRREGPATLDRFSAGPSDQAWYFNAVASAVEHRVPKALTGELRAKIAEFSSLAMAPLRFGDRSACANAAA